MTNKQILSTIGVSNSKDHVRAQNDFYASPPKAVEQLIDIEKFSKKIWEPACGEGHISKVLVNNGYDVYSTDLINRGYGDDFFDFLQCDKKWGGDIITNPPFKLAAECIYKALESINTGNKVAMLLKLQYLEGVNRRKLYEKYPPKTIYVSVKRLQCGMNGEFTGRRNALCYAWFVWEKGFHGDPMKGERNEEKGTGTECWCKDR